jgi:hypothetical protein
MKRAIKPGTPPAPTIPAIPPADVLGRLAALKTTATPDLKHQWRELFAADRYTDYLYFHGLGVQMAEALAEWTHARIRRELGFVAEEPSALRDVLLASITDTNIDDAELFNAYVHGKLPSDMLQTMLNDSLNLPFSSTLTEEDATLLWSESASAYRLALLQTELQELQDSMGHSMDEATYNRMIEVQSALKQAHAERSFSRATDVA